MKILIGTSAFFGATKHYLMDIFPEARVSLASVETILNADLLALTGGADISPELYLEPNRFSSTLLQRDFAEVFFTNIALRKGIPIVGFCRGHQLINTIVGGSLFQDLPSAHGSIHELDILVDDPLLSGMTTVNSMHHQGVKTVAEGVDVIAVFKGIPEITISRKYKFVSTQFHPEFHLPSITSQMAIDRYINKNIGDFV